jgi:hypothetical protein
MASYLLPDGRTVSDSMAFTLVGIQYPSNWLLLSTEQDRSQRNITGPLPEPTPSGLVIPLLLLSLLLLMGWSLLSMAALQEEQFYKQNTALKAFRRP